MDTTVHTMTKLDSHAPGTTFKVIHIAAGTLAHWFLRGQLPAGRTVRGVDLK